VPRSKSAPKFVSQHVNFLEQRFAMVDNPHANYRKLAEVGTNWATPVNEANGMTKQDRDKLLTHGVSYNGEGRCAYLRASYMRLPQEREEYKNVPVTSNQNIGFYVYPDWNPKTLCKPKPMKLGPGKDPGFGLKNFFQRTPLTGMRRPENDAMGRPLGSAFIH
jgi:hypothetical protein